MFSVLIKQNLNENLLCYLNFLKSKDFKPKTTLECNQYDKNVIEQIIKDYKQEEFQKIMLEFYLQIPQKNQNILTAFDRIVDFD